MEQARNPMQNSHKSIFLGLYRGIFADISINFPNLSIDRDCDKLTVLVNTRGLRFLTIDLPAFGKHFDRCLSTGKLEPSRMPGFGVRVGQSSPKFLSGLISLVFDKDGVIRSEPCTLAIGFLRQLFYAAKKPKFECPSEAKELAYERYLCIENELPYPTLQWDRPDRIRRDCHSIHMLDFHDDDPDCEIHGRGFSSLLQDTADFIVSEWDQFDPYTWKPSHGPGAVADQQSGGDKYLFPTWSSRLESVFPSADLAIANYGLWGPDGPLLEDVEVPAKILTVPKSQTKPRLIAKEPIGAMWCQQILLRYLMDQTDKGVLNRTIHFRDQRYNADLALESSSTGSHATIDLSDASDRLSLRLVERLLRRSPSFLEAASAARSRHVSICVRGSEQIIELKKFAAQGSATTFPVQSICFAIMAIASVLHSRGLRATRKTIVDAGKEVLVFGDDTIIPSDSAEAYVRLLTWGGLRVNQEKSFLVGKFRESCGTEAYDGVDVTPAYLTKPLEDLTPEAVVATIDCSNNFFIKGYWRAAEAILAPIPRSLLQQLAIVRTPENGSYAAKQNSYSRNFSGVFGLQSFMGTNTEHLKRRYVSDLCRDEVKYLQLKAEVPKLPRDGIQSLLQFFIEEPSQETNWSSGVEARPKTRLTSAWGAAYF